MNGHLLKILLPNCCLRTMACKIEAISPLLDGEQSGQDLWSRFYLDPIAVYFYF